MLRLLPQTKRKLNAVTKSIFMPSFRPNTGMFYSGTIIDPGSESNYLNYSRKKRKFKRLPPLDPFNLGEESNLLLDSRENEDFHSRLPLSVIRSLNKYSISAELVSASALGNDDHRISELTQLVDQFSDQTTHLEQVDLYRVLLLKYSLVKLDTSRLVYTINALIQNGLDAARMLERQPTVVSLDPATLANNIESLLRIIKPERNEVTFDYSLYQELKRLSTCARECTDKEKYEGVDIVYRLYQSGKLDQLSELRVYKRVFKAIKATFLAGECTDTEVYRDCSAVYKRLVRVALTDLCSKYFKEVALGLSEEFVSDLEVLRGNGLENNRWVGRFLKSTSATKILLRDSHTTQQLGPQLALLKEFGIKVNKLSFLEKCPMLLNTPVSDIKRSIDILGSPPFYCNRNDIRRVFVRDPSIFIIPTILDHSRHQLGRIVFLKQRQVSWHNVVKQTPKVLTIKNYARIFELFKKNEFSQNEIITIVEYYPSILKQIEKKIEKLESEGSAYKPYITKMGLTTKIQFIKKRIAKETAQRYPGYANSELASPSEEEYSDWGPDGSEDREEFSTDPDRETEDNDNLDI